MHLSHRLGLVRIDEELQSFFVHSLQVHEFVQQFNPTYFDQFQYQIDQISALVVDQLFVHLY